MLNFKYNKKRNYVSNPISEISISSSKKNLLELTNFIDEQLRDLKCTKKIKSEINIILDEIFSNISKYAYKNSEGMIHIKSYITESPKSLNIIFEDNGKEYNPLNSANIQKDVKLNDRKYGGLGLAIVKDLADAIKYEYIKNSNILTITKKLK